MSTRTKAVLLMCGLALVALFAIPALASDNSPKDWLDDHYTVTSGADQDDETIAYRSDDDLDTTVNAIIAGTDPDDTTQGDATSTPDGSTPDADTARAVYLRYDSDWIVAVTADGTGSRIELDEFDRGYNRHGGAVFLGVWGSHYGRGGGGSFFRGGGSGFGK
ncbi:MULTISPECIES: DUF4247 domain-containing protein [unclassified Nocardioides]|uniref:DUF4247 domain-containing protein n=1 Tax=unclassified Nocardioides TaxID=2615069 RepID=UPI003014BB05